MPNGLTNTCPKVEYFMNIWHVILGLLRSRVQFSHYIPRHRIVLQFGKEKGKMGVEKMYETAQAPLRFPQKSPKIEAFQDISLFIKFDLRTLNILQYAWNLTVTDCGKYRCSIYSRIPCGPKSNLDSKTFRVIINPSNPSGYFMFRQV